MYTYIAVIYEITFWISLHLNYSEKFSLFFEVFSIVELHHQFFLLTVCLFGRHKSGFFFIKANSLLFLRKYKYLIPHFFRLASNCHNINCERQIFTLYSNLSEKIKMKSLNIEVCFSWLNLGINSLHLLRNPQYAF